jgi:hypothetical protein
MSFLDSIGRGLTSTMGSMIPGMGALGSLMGSGGNRSGGALSGFGGGNNGNGLFDMFSSIAKPLAPMLGTLGKVAGTYFGGPAGGMAGGMLGDMAGQYFGGQQQGQQEPQQFGPQQSYGNQFGTGMGNALNQGFNQYMPQQLQGQTFGNAGGALGDYFGQQFGHPNAGRAIGNMLNPYLQNSIPQSLRGETMGNFGGYLGQQAGQQFDQGAQRYGFSPTMGRGGYGGGYGGGQQNNPALPAPSYQAPSYGGGQDDYSGAPEAPPFGPMQGQGYSAPQAPRFNQGNAYGGGQQSDARSNMLSQIRGYSRPAPAQGGGYGGGYGGAPEAPPIGDAGRYAPGSNRFEMRSSAHPGPSGNMFDELRQRNGGGMMGLRPAQTRASNAYPRDLSESDFMSRMAARRGVIEPGRY